MRAYALDAVHKFMRMHCMCVGGVRVWRGLEAAWYLLWQRQRQTLACRVEAR